VLGFTIYRSIIQLWIFDKSGPYNSKMFDIHKELERFVNFLISYIVISNAELSLNTFINRDGNGKYFFTRDMRIFLKNKPIVLTKAIICPITPFNQGRRPGSTN